MSATPIEPIQLPTRVQESRRAQNEPVPGRIAPYEATGDGRELERDFEVNVLGVQPTELPVVAQPAVPTTASEPRRAEAPKRVLSKRRLVLLGLIALLPMPLKRLAYRWLLGYRIGRGVRIGLSIVDAAECEIGDETRIGHFNVFMRLGKLKIGDHCRIGIMNVFRGGDEISIGRYVDVLRMNVVNSIPENDCVGKPDPRLTIGDGSVVTEGHRLDFTDRVEIGKRVIVGGRNSSLWTHNRKRTKPIRIGDRCYLGSEIRVAPGVTLPRCTVVGLGSVLVGEIRGEKKLVGGNPGRVLRDLGADDLAYVTEPTRPDLPGDLCSA